MKKNNDSIELESNSKRFHVEVDLWRFVEDNWISASRDKTNCKLYLYVLEHNYIFVEFIHLFY